MRFSPYILILFLLPSYISAQEAALTGIGEVATPSSPKYTDDITPSPPSAKIPETAIISNTEKKSVNKQETTVAIGDNTPKNTAKSVFFSNSEFDKIKTAESICGNKNQDSKDGSVKEADFLKSLETVITGSKTSTQFTYPQFFLSSILYHSPNEWVVWVNGQRMDSENKQNTNLGLQVLSIDKDKASFEWIPERMDMVRDVIDPKQKDILKVDLLNRKIVFTLHGNQSFSSYAMQIVEGRILPITLDLQ